MKGLTENEPQAPTSNSGTAVFALRLLQIVSFAAAVVGFIWSTGDVITSMFPAESVVTPVSVLLMLYGGIGTLGLEAVIRYLTRKKAA